MAEPVGRPTLMTPETISKLESIFAIGGSDLEACSWANISKTTLYNYQNEHPEFVERKEMLREKPFLKARQTVVRALENPSDAQWYLERKKKNEFSVRVEKTGADGKDLSPDISIVVKDLTLKLNEIYRGSGIGSDGETPLALDTETQGKE